MPGVKELVVVSGKGGTGKTSVVGSFAALAGDAVLADCDVDAADLHLLLAPEVETRETFCGGQSAAIRPEACTACGLCLEHCRFRAVVAEETPLGTTFRVDPIACEGCGVCALVCPAGAVEFGPKQNGEWYVSRTRHGPMVHAKLGIAESNSGKLVTLVRRKSREVAEASGRRLVIVDGPPGIGCPVIASIAAASLVLAVTEPTLSGIHDLERVVQLAGHFDLPAGVLVNKFDINLELSRSVEAFCGERGLPVVGRIPYDLGVTKAQLRGLSVVETDGGPAAEAIRRSWDETRRLLDAAEET
jgi:MinD superfamily P-loop ATPase